MDVTFTEDQAMLRNTARRFVSNELSIDYIRSIVDGQDTFTEQKWNKLTQLGCHGILIPEEFGGLGLSFVDLAVVLEEMGRAPLPGPFVSTVVLAGEAIRLAGSAEQKAAFLPKIAGGELKATLAWAEPEYLYDADSFKTQYQRTGSEITLNGIKIFVTDASLSDLIVCAAKGPDGPGLLMLPRGMPGLEITPLKTMDRTMDLCEVVFNDVRVGLDALLDKGDGASNILNKLLDRINVAYAFDMIGGTDRVLNIAVEYANVREQFGQPIGAFQAIKHRCADMLMGLEGARSIAYHAAWAQDNDSRHATIHASTAKIFCSEVYAGATRDVLQVLGGIGFSWENELHIYLKRAKCLGALFGDPSFHRERLARELNY
jgi:alkylation response protein AidB-like acyl-CoA dehydrogenase